MAYYLAERNGEISRLVRQYFEKFSARLEEIRALKTRLGAKDILLNWDGVKVIGVAFKNPPPEGVWRKLKNGSYLPRRNTKAGKQMWEEITFEPISDRPVGQACGYMDFMIIEDVMYKNPGYCLSKDGLDVLITIPDKVVTSKKYKLPSGVKEITLEQYTSRTGVQ